MIGNLDDCIMGDVRPLDNYFSKVTHTIEERIFDNTNCHGRIVCRLLHFRWLNITWVKYVLFLLYVDNCFVSGCRYMTALQVIIHKMTVHQMIVV